MLESTQEMTGKELFVAEFERREQQREGGDHTWLRELRRLAMARFEALGFPNQRVEEWRFTNLAPLTQVAFRPAAPGERAEAQAEPAARAAAFDGAECCRMVFVNGRFSRALSKLEGLDAGVQAMSLAEALEREPALVQAHLARYAAYDKQPYVALNTALWDDGAFIRVEAGKVIESPLHMIYVTTGEAEEPAYVNVRNLILVGENSQARVMESYVGAGAAAYFTTW